MKIDWNKYPDTHPNKAGEYLCTVEYLNIGYDTYTELEILEYSTDKDGCYFSADEWRGQGFYSYEDKDMTKAVCRGDVIAWADIEPYNPNPPTEEELKEARRLWRRIKI